MLSEVGQICIPPPPGKAAEAPVLLPGAGDEVIETQQQGVAGQGTREVQQEGLGTAQEETLSMRERERGREGRG